MSCSRRTFFVLFSCLMLILIITRINTPPQQAHQLTAERMLPHCPLGSEGQSTLGSNWWNRKFTSVFLRTDWACAHKTPQLPFSLVTEHWHWKEPEAPLEYFSNEETEAQRREVIAQEHLRVSSWTATKMQLCWVQCSGSQTWCTEESPRELVKNSDPQDPPLSHSCLEVPAWEPEFHVPNSLPQKVWCHSDRNRVVLVFNL